MGTAQCFFGNHVYDHLCAPTVERLELLERNETIATDELQKIITQVVVQVGSKISDLADAQDARQEMLSNAKQTLS